MASMSDSPTSDDRRRAILLGIGLDNADGHVRVTRGQEFYLVGGSQDTHERMQEKAVRFTEELDRRGKHMGDISRDEFTDIVRHISKNDH